MSTGVVRQLITRLGYKVDDKNLKRYDSQISKLATGLGSLAVAAAAAAAAIATIGAGLFIGQLVNTNIEFEKLKASLKTVTGSAEAGQDAFKFIQNFASSTPFQVQEVTQAFLKLKALGIEPTEARLRSFGNTAAAIGKPLDQFIEAVADASTGEFERLKEFGIKSKKAGDQVSFTFQGVTTKVKNNSEAINGFLQSIGDNNFAGAMAAQMLTLGGIISNIKDGFDKFLLTAGEAGFNDALRGFLTVVRDLVGGGDDLAVTIGQNLGKAVVGLTKALSFVAEHAGTFFSIAKGVATFVASAIPGVNIIAAIALGIDDLMTLMRGGDSLFERIFGPKVAGFLRAFANTLQVILIRRIQIVIEIFNRMRARVSQVFAALGPPLKLWIESIRRLLAVLFPTIDSSDGFADAMVALIPIFEKVILGIGIVLVGLVRMSTTLANLATVVFPVFSAAFDLAFDSASIAIAIFTGNFSEAKDLWLGWLTQVTDLAAKLGVDISGITGGIRQAASLVGITPSSIAATSGGGGAGGGTGGTTSNQTNSVGTVLVQVAGSTNMGPDEIASATQTGTSRGMRDAFADANRNLQGGLT